MTTPVDVLASGRHEAAHRTLRDAEQYLDRITEQYGPGHDETRYATRLANDARTAHESKDGCPYPGYTMTIAAVPPDYPDAGIGRTLDFTDPGDTA